MTAPLVLKNPKGVSADEFFLHFVGVTQELEDHVLFQSSGSTGNPKWVALSKLALEVSAKSVNEWLKVTTKDVFGLALPPFHVGGFGIIERARVSECSQFVLGSWDAKAFCQWCETKRITLTSLVPTQIYDLVKLSLISPINLRAIVVGGGKLPHDLYQQARKLGWPLLPSYGLTECSSQVATSKIESLEKSEYPKAFLLSHVKATQTGKKSVHVSSASLLTGYLTKTERGWELVDPKDDGQFLLPDAVSLLTNGEGTQVTVEGRREEEFKILGEWVRWDFIRGIFYNLSLEKNLFGKVEIVILPDARQENRVTLACEHFSDAVSQLAFQFNKCVLPFERITHLCETTLPRNDLGKILSGKLADQIKMSAKTVSLPQ